MLISMNNCVSGIRDFNFFIIAYDMQHNNLYFFPQIFPQVFITVPHVQKTCLKIIACLQLDVKTE